MHSLRVGGRQANKPFSCAQWAATRDDPSNADEVIVLIDPDMILLNPLSIEPEESYNLIIQPARETSFGYNVPKPGTPVAQCVTMRGSQCMFCVCHFLLVCSDVGLCKTRLFDWNR